MRYAFFPGSEEELSDALRFQLLGGRSCAGRPELGQGCACTCVRAYRGGAGRGQGSRPRRVTCGPDGGTEPFGPLVTLQGLVA